MNKTSCVFLLFILFFIHCSLYSDISPAQKLPPQTPPPVSQVDRQVAQAQADFETAYNMFNPYYAGPLLTPGAHNVPPGKFNIQPYIFFTNTYGQFNDKRHVVNMTDLWQLKGSFIFQMGWLSWLDFTVVFNAQKNWQGNKSAGNFGDTQITFGFQLVKEQPYKPALRITVQENLPTGKYEKLNAAKAGVQATGTGSYATSIAFNISKVVWWFSTHPFTARASFNYTVPTAVHVQGFNAYGGGFDTRGKVYPGNEVAIDTSIELSFTQNWVFAIDLVYTYQNRSRFSGHKGRTTLGTTAPVGAPSNDSLSCAPAIEYNLSANMGFLFGAWFPITGRNSSDFIAAILTMTYMW